MSASGRRLYGPNKHQAALYKKARLEFKKNKLNLAANLIHGIFGASKKEISTISDVANSYFNIFSM